MTATYGSFGSMTLAVSQTDSNTSLNGIFGIAGSIGAAGVGQTVTLTSNKSGIFAEAGAISVTCSNTTTVFDGNNGNTGTATSASQSISSTTAEIVVSELGFYSASQPATATGTGHTIRINNITAGGNNFYMGTMPGQASTTTPGYNFNASGGFGFNAVSFAHQ